MAQNAAVSLFAGQMGRICAAATDANDTLAGISTPTIDAPPVMNCTTDPSNPLCHNPYASSSGGGSGGPGSPYVPPPPGSTNPNDFNTAGNDGDPSQNPVTGGGVNGGDSRSAGVPNGGGGMLGGGGGGGAFGGGAAGKGGRNAGHNTDVLQGERSGGYSVSSAGGVSAGGGWSGYGGGGGAEPREKSRGLDLSKFLPGEKDNAARGPAGLGRATADVAPMTVDIFQKISDRVQVICKMKRLECN